MFPATTHASKDTPKKERRRVPSYDKSIQGHPRRKEGEERKERKQREEEKGRGEKSKKQVFPATNKRPGTHQRKKGVILSLPGKPQKARKERGGKGKEGGLSSRQVPMNLEQISVAVTTHGLPEGCHL